MGKEITHLAWVDLETTGTDERRDDIIEFALIVTDMALNVVYEYDAVVGPESYDWLERIKEVDAVLKMHTNNGLINDIMNGECEQLYHLDRWISQELEHTVQIEPHAVMLAGSGVGHFDRRFIRWDMPHFNRILAYPVIDVGVMRRFIRDVCGRPDMVPSDGDGAIKTHRAADDVALHLSEARYYRNTLGAALDDAKIERIDTEGL